MRDWGTPQLNALWTAFTEKDALTDALREAVIQAREALERVSAEHRAAARESDSAYTAWRDAMLARDELEASA